MKKERSSFMNEKERNLSKVLAWVHTPVYKQARKLAIDLDLPWRIVVEEGLKLFVNTYTNKKEYLNKKEE